jgi:arsenate reductase
MITIYHYSKCSKSRAGLCEIEKHSNSIQIRNYFKDLFTRDELISVLNKLNIKPLDLVRTNESIWKENFSSKKLATDEIMDALLLYPQLIERPIVVFNERAVIARPIEKINELQLHI